jgi:hypothetical protein
MPMTLLRTVLTGAGNGLDRSRESRTDYRPEGRRILRHRQLFGRNSRDMTKSLMIGLAVCSLALPQVAYGQMSMPHGNTSFQGAERLKELSTAPSGGGFSLLDPSRLKMSQSYSISYISGSGYSGSLGLYTNTVSYQIADPLMLRVGLGYLHQPLGFLRNSGGRELLGSDKFLPSVSLDYRPSDAFHLSVDYRTVPVLWQDGLGTGYGYRTRSIFNPYSPWYR